MQRVDLKKVLEMLINEEQGNAEDLLHQWFVEKTKTIHESLMQEDDDVLEKEDLSKDIEDDKDSIKAEEYFGEGDFDDEEGNEESHIDAMAAKDVEDGGDLATDDFGDEDDSEGVDDNDAVDNDTDMEEISDKVEDLEAELNRLKSKFKAIQNGEDAEHEDSDEEHDGEDTGMDSPLSDTDDAEEDTEDKDHDGVDESFLNELNSYEDLDEAFNLELIKDPGLDGGKEIGATGAKVNVNTTSPIPQRKTTDRVGGKTVEIKDTPHKGFDRETAPKVSEKNPLRNQSVGNAIRDYTPISKEGDKQAMLNKKDGFGSDSPKSPIGAGATDLRGDTFKRK